MQPKHKQLQPMEEDQITKMSRQIDKLYTTICGDERMGVKGLIGEHREMRRDIDKLQAMRWYLVGAIAAIGFLLSLLK